jgi:hypothetical protein
MAGRREGMAGAKNNRFFSFMSGSIEKSSGAI